MPHLLVAGKLHPAGEVKLADLQANGFTVDYVEDVSEASYASLIHKADALVIRTQPLSAATIAKAKRLKVVSRHGVGYDSVDTDALNKRGIALTIVGDVNSISVAEHALMQLIAASKRVLRSDRAVRKPAEWSWRNELESQEISGKNLLIIGYGRTGRHLARMVAVFGMTVRAYDPFLANTGWPEGAVESVEDLTKGLAWADYASIHTPKSDKPLLGTLEINAMKPGLILSNTARGGVVDEAALAEALKSGQVGAAGVDVFDIEPADGSSPLADLDNVVLSPHIAGLTAEAAERMAIASIENATAYLDGSINSHLIINQDHING